MILNTISSKDLLIDAYKFYSRGDARAHDALRIIINRNDMSSAVLGCLSEASKEEEPQKQKLYVQAACFGKKFHPGIAIDEFQVTCRSVRVANICRSENVDTNLEMTELIDKLIERRQFSLALWIVKWLKIDGDAKILLEWSEYLIGKSFMRDDDVVKRIQERLGRNPVVSYADVAVKAINHNRHKLAIKLLENENQSVKQIPLLLSLGQYDLVLALALATCDSNLIYMAIFKLKDSIMLEEKFRELLKKHHRAYKYYCNFLAVTDPSKLILISHIENSRDELALCLMDNRHESALAVCKKTKQEFAAHHIEMGMRLNKYQQGIKLDPPPVTNKQASWVGLSISDTIINLVALNQISKARDVQKKFDISEKKFKVLEQIATNSLPKLTITVPS